MGLHENGENEGSATNTLLSMLLASEEEGYLRFRQHVLIDIIQYILHLDSDFIDVEILAKLLNKDQNYLLDKYIDPLCRLPSMETRISDGKEGIKNSIDKDQLGIQIHSLLEEKGLPQNEILNNLVVVFNKLMPEITENSDESWNKAKNLSKHIKKILEGAKNIEFKLNAPDFIEFLNKMSFYTQYVDIDYVQALEYQKMALEAISKLPEENLYDIATAYNNIGATYKCIGGQENLEEALKHLEEALKIARKIYPHNHPETANYLANIGVIYLILGGEENLSKSLKHQEEALDIRMKLHQGASVEIINSFNNLGDTYEAMGGQENLSITLDYQIKALEIARKLYHGNHPEIVTFLTKIAMIYQDLGDLESALEYQTESLEMSRNLDHKATSHFADALINMSFILNDLGEKQKFIEHFIQAYTVYRNLDGNDHQEMITQLEEKLQKMGVVDVTVLSHHLPSSDVYDSPPEEEQISIIGEND